MSEMVERVAKQVDEKIGHMLQTAGTNLRDQDLRYVILTVIEAMCEPDDDIVGAMMIAIATRSQGREISRESAREAFQFVISAAL